MRLRAALLRASGTAFVLVAPLLLYGAALRANLARDIASLAGSQPPPRAAVEARVLACGSCGIDALVQALAGPAPVPAMNLLRSMGGPQVIAPLVAALDDRDEDVRHAAGMTLAYIGADAVPALVEALGRSPVPHVRASAAWALSFMGAAGTPALPALQAALDDESQDVRYVARYAIAQLSSGNEAFWTAVDRARSKSSPPPAAGPPR